MISEEKGLHQLFETQAAKTPDSLAIVFRDGQTSYAQLDQSTDALGAYLRRCGVSTDDSVGIFMETCPEYIVASIGTLKAGGAFMPMALDSPAPLLRAVLSESQPKVVLTKAQHLPRLGQFTGTRILPIDSDQSWLSFDAGKHGARVAGDNLAFLPYTLRHDGGPEGSDADWRFRCFFLLRQVQVEFLQRRRQGCLQHLLPLGVPSSAAERRNGIRNPR